MVRKICIDLFTDQPLSWVQKYHYKMTLGPHGTYYTVIVNPVQKKEVLKKAHQAGIRYRFYEEQWARSSNYRQTFFQHHPPPYRCRYCNRKLSGKKLVVDHIVPVAKAKKSGYARWLLTSRGIENVNDVRNLAPSCVRCNRRKSDKLGIWYLRGRFGKYLWFRILYKAAKLGLLVLILYLLYKANFFEYIASIL